MKKFLFVFVLASIGIAGIAEQLPQFIITECGTVHKIKDNATIDEAIAEIDRWTEIDCPKH